VAPGFQQDLFLINHVLLLRGMEQERKPDGGSIRADGKATRTSNRYGR